MIFHVHPISGSSRSSTCTSGRVTWTCAAASSSRTIRPGARPSLTQAETTVALPEGVILEGPLHQNVPPARLRRRNRDDEDLRRLHADGIRRAEDHVHEGRQESLDLVGRTYDCVVFDQLNHVTGVKSKMWLNRDDYFAVKIELPNRRVMPWDSSFRGS